MQVLRKFARMVRSLWQPRRFPLHPVPAEGFLPADGSAWSVALPQFQHHADGDDHPRRSSLVLYENGVQLPITRPSLRLVKYAGLGRYRHWDNALLFTATDNTDPRTNGRIYEYAFLPEGACTPRSGFVPDNFLRRRVSPDLIEADVNYALQVIAAYSQQMNRLGNLSGKRILEMGPGINFGPALYLAGLGAHVTVADRHLSPWEPRYHTAFYQRFREVLRRKHPHVNLRPLDLVLDTKGYHPEAITLHERSGEDLALETASIDVSLSNAVFEHLSDLPQVFRQLRRVMKPTSQGHHQVDFRLHQNDRRPLDHLLLTDEDLVMLTAERDHEWGTLLRPYEVQRMLEEAGFQVEMPFCTLADENYFADFLRLLPESPQVRYRTASPDQLRILGCRFDLS